jgi:2-succinyl-6-hydroxy-2,4-cyclohexadiene-1-carboxylate synthase
VVLVDAPGHGGSTSVSAAFTAGAEMIGAAGERGTYLGYSMGGRYALALALERPELVERLVLVGASPGLADPDERAARHRADATLAARIEQLGVPAFLDEWLAQPLFVGLTPAMRMLPERLRNTAAGLADSLRTAGTGEQPSLWDRLGELTMPVLVVSGSQDAKFTSMGDRMTAAIGANARRLVVPNAGHTAHLEKPDAFLSGLRAWLSSTSPAAAAR